MSALIAFAPKAVSKKSVGAMAAALLANATASGFPVVSIKGKVFHIVRDGDRTLVTKPGEDDPASAMEVVIVGANPNRSRVFYATGYEEGSNAKPDCYSNDGKAPASDSASPQAKSCAACVHSQYGSKVSESGQKGYACANSQRIAIVPGDVSDDPMLLRIPGASLKAFTEYVREVVRAGYDLDEVVTRIGFDYSVAHPALVFKATKPLADNDVATARQIGTQELVGQIVGTIAMPHAEEESFESPVAALPKKTAKAKAEVAEPTPELEEIHAKAESKPKAKVKVEEEAPAKPAPKAVATVDDLGDDLDSLLDGTDFDD
jgi:hypothetical protein